VAALTSPDLVRPIDDRARGLVGPVVGAGVVALSLVSTWVAVGPGQRSWHGLLDDNILNNTINGIVLGTIATVLLWLRPSNRIGWLMFYVALVNALTVLCTGWALTTFHVGLPGRAAAAWLGSWVWVPALPLGATVLPAIYPTGRAESPVARWVVRLGWGGGIVAAVAVAMLDGAYRDVVPGHALGHNPVSGGSGEPVFVAMALTAAVAEAVLVLVTFGWTLRRLQRATSPEREQLAWLVLSVTPLLVGVFLNSALVMFLITVATSVTLVIGIVRYQLFDIKLVLRSGLVYAVLTGLAVGVYFGVVAVITTMTARGTVPTLFALATVGLVLVPAHGVLQRSFSRLVYGDRADPLRALSRVAEGIRVVDADDPSGMRPMLEGIAMALRSPYVALHGPDGETLASVGALADQPLHGVDLEHAGQAVGRLDVAGRTSRDPLGAADRRLLAALSGPVAAAVRAARTARELADSRSRVLAAREGERRRLREDLHDGLGPSLSGVALGLEAARRSIAGDPERVGEILEVLHGEVDSLVAEVRGIIDDLGPGDVDLPRAVRSHVDAVAATGEVDVELTATGDLADVPGEVAVAAHRIAGEALTNAARHARARTIRVALTGHKDHLVVEVADDGTGAVRHRAGGVGLDSMRQRAESVGGVLTVSAVPDHGTRVRAVLPLQVAT
jgi:signal transduction histidine kinase